MTSLLCPVALESCQTNIRGRRRSSHCALDAVPRVFSTATPTSYESAICDDLIPLDASRSNYSPSSNGPTRLPLSTLSDAHVSDYLTSTTVGRHNSSAPMIYAPVLSSTESVVKAEPSSHKISPHGLESNEIDSPSTDRLRLRLACGFFAYFLCGWGDGVTGTVLPYFTADFHLTPMTSSLLFAGSTCGFFTGTLIVEPVMNFLGRCSSKRSTTSLVPYVPRISHWWSYNCNEVHTTRHSKSQARHLILTLASLLHAIFFIMIGTKASYPITFIAYAIAAFARSFLSATLNVYFASGPPQSLGYSYGLWSLGGVLSPIVCQTVISNGVPWHNFYLGSLVLSGINATLLSLAFKPTVQEASREWHKWTVKTSISLSSLSSPASEVMISATLPAVPIKLNTLRLAFSLLYQWAFSVVAMLYCGSETVTQGFMVTYLLGTREADPKTAGYVTSGFWGGITIGRFTWGYFVTHTSFTQRKYVVLGCLCMFSRAREDQFSHTLLAAALALHLLIWFVDSNVENAVSASIIGALYGPIFPAILRLANDILPAEVRMISMGLISTFASIGAALFPFVVGVISSLKGIRTLPYVTVPLEVVLIGLWSLFPNYEVPRRSSMD